MKVDLRSLIGLLVFAGSLQSFAGSEFHPAYVGAVSINPCQDPQILADWYAKIGIATHKGPDGGFYGTFETQGGPFVFGIHKKNDNAPQTCPASMAVVFRVDAFDTFIAEVRKRGLMPKVDQYPEGRFAQMKDPDGNDVSLWGK